MNREHTLKIILVIFGALFVAALYPMVFLVRQEPTLQMMLSLYVTLGVFLLLAARNPSAHRSLIAFAAWSSFAHAATMAVQSFFDAAERTHLLLGTLMFVVIALPLLFLAPTKRCDPVGRLVSAS
jgi:hypothetical protein